MRPAIGLLELSSIAAGIAAGDAMVKRAPVAVAYAGTVHPGKFLILVAGEVADVEEALAAGREQAASFGQNDRGRGGCLTDELFLPDADPRLAEALLGRLQPARGEALGVVETRTVASLLAAADRGLKGAEVALAELRLADDLGGKAYCLFAGEVADVEEAVELATAGLPRPELLVARAVIPRLHEEMRENLEAAAELRARLRAQRPGSS